MWFGDLKGIVDQRLGPTAYWALVNFQIIYGWSDRTPVYVIID